jgi:hypothetical protein
MEKDGIHDLQGRQAADQPNGIETIYEGVIPSSLSDIF